MRIVLRKSILVGLQRSIFGLPSSTLSQKMCFRVGRPHFFNWKSEDGPHENTSFEIKCRKVVQIWIFFCRKPRVSTQTPIGREARNHHHHQREKERARESKTKKESKRERERGEGEKGSQSLYTLKSPPPDRPPLRRPLCYYYNTTIVWGRWVNSRHIVHSRG